MNVAVIVSYLFMSPGPQIIKLFPCSTQLRMKFQLLIKGKTVKNNYILAFKLSDVVFILLMNVKMPTIVGILTFMSRIISFPVELGMKNVM